MDSDQENQATTASEENNSSPNSVSSVNAQEDFSKLSVADLKSKLKDLKLLKEANTRVIPSPNRGSTSLSSLLCY